MDDLLEVLKINEYFDIYGELLTSKQKEIFIYYYQDNLSLSEISEIENISRNGVYDTLKKAKNLLLDYENKLKIYESKYAFLDKLNKLHDENHIDDYALSVLKGE